MQKVQSLRKTRGVTYDIGGNTRGGRIGFSKMTLSFNKISVVKAQRSQQD